MVSLKSLISSLSPEANHTSRPHPLFFQAGSITKDSPLYKAVIPQFLVNPPFGVPRFDDLPELRRLSATPYVEMAVDAIVGQVSATEWDIVPRKEGDKLDESASQKIKDFLENPNINPDESFDTLLQKSIRDVIEIQAGCFNKVFSVGGDLKEVYAIDGGTITKNPNLFGNFAGCAQIMPPFYMLHNLKQQDAKKYQEQMKRAAYYQYGWNSPLVPQAFGTQEIIYIQTKPRTDSIYARGAIHVLQDVLQMLKYGVDHNLEYFTDNNIPKGVLQILDANEDEVKAFQEAWKSNLQVPDQVGKMRKLWHKMPIINRKGEFIKVQFSNAELELLEQQRWFSKVVWACLGATPSELGMDESPARAHEVVQSKVYRRRTLVPMLKKYEYQINAQLIWPHFSPKVKFTFDMYDLAEDVTRHQLYAIQIQTGIKTPNEIREEMGLDPLPQGDYGPGQSPEQDPFEGNEDNPRETTADEEIEKADKEKKSFGSTDSPLTLRDNEKLDEKKISHAIKFLNREFEKKIVREIDRYSEHNMTLNEIKGFKSVGKIPDDLAEKLKNIISYGAAAPVVKAAIRKVFLDGIEDMEKSLSMNFIPNPRVLEFLEGHTFDNVKDMEAEIANDLRAELERGILNGEGVPKLKERVKKVMDVADNRAEAIARTETIRAEAVARNDAAKQADIPLEKEWDATLDDRTSVVCQSLHGKRVGMGENFKAKGFEGPHEPAHINCRSKVLYVPKKV